MALVGSVLESGRTVAGGTRAGAPVGISILAGIGLTSTDTGVGRGVGDAATAFMGSGVGGIGATALFAAAGTTDGLVSGTTFVSGTGLISATGLAPTVGRVSIPCLITADCNASASGLMPAAGLISVAGFGTTGAGAVAGFTGGVAPAVGGCGPVVAFEAAVAAGSDGSFGSDLAGEAATAEIFFWARFFAGSFCRGLAIHLQSWFACEKIKLIGKTKLSQEISRRMNFSPTGLIHPPCMPYLRTNRKVRVTQQGHAHCVPAYVLDAGISKSPCIRVGFHV